MPQGDPVITVEQAPRPPLVDRLGLPRLDRPGSGSLIVATWIDALGRGLFMYFYLLFLTRDVGFNLNTAGAVLSVVTALGLAVTPIAGSLVDRIGARQMMIASQVVCAAGYAGLLLIPESVPLLLLTAGLATVGECIFWVGYPNLVSQIADENSRDRWFAFMGMSRTAGFGLGGLIAAGVIALIGEDGYRVLLGANVVTYLIAATIIVLRVPVMRRIRSAREHGGWLAVIRDRTIMQLAAAHGFGVLVILLVFQGLPLYVVDVLDLPAWVPGVLLGVNTLILATGQSLGLRFVAGWRRTRIYVLCSAIWIAGAVLFALGEWIPAALVIPYLFLVMALASGGEVFHLPQNGGLPTALAPEALRGRYLALFSLVWSAAGIFSPTIVSALISVSGVLLWAGMAVAAGIAAAIALVSEGSIDPEVQRTPAQG
jgi:MFS family permease